MVFLWFFGIIIAFIAILEIIKKLADRKAIKEANAEISADVTDANVKDTNKPIQVNIESKAEDVNKGEDKIKFGFWEFIGLGFFVYVIYFLFFSGFNPNEKQEFEMSEIQKNPYVSAVSDYTLNGKKAVSVNVSWVGNRYEITMLRSEIKEGVTLERISQGIGGNADEWKTKVIDASANINNQYYAFNSRDNGVNLP